MPEGMQEGMPEDGQEGQQEGEQEGGQTDDVADVGGAAPAMKSLCYVTAVPMTVRAFLGAHVRTAAARWKVSVVTGTDDPALLAKMGLPATLLPVPIARDIAPLGDLRAIFVLWRRLRAGRFDLVHSLTPKAGLIGMLAARLAGVPLRVHTFTGQVWATRTGPVRWLFKAMDRVLAACATHLLVDSASQRLFLIDQGIAPAAKLTVLGAGSVSGVDTARFRPDSGLRTEVRAQHGIAPEAVVFVFVGRLVREKGLIELVQAFGQVAARDSGAWLLLIGPDEAGLLPGALEPLPRPARARVHCEGDSAAPERYLVAGDVFVLPSYREGFGTSVIEAAGAGLPAIASRVYGLVDAVEEGVTGLLVPPRDAAALAGGMMRLLEDRPLRERLGCAARARVERVFSQQQATADLMAFYETLAAR
jgi:glycosyltransferase involved in cell wall biosynthesis